MYLYNFKKYAIDINEYKDTSVVQRYSSANAKIINEIGNKNIKQTFKTYKPFNSIEIKFKNVIKTDKTVYNFLLKDKENNILYSQKFSSNMINNNGYCNFKTDEIDPLDNNEYVIEIFADDVLENEKTMRNRNLH